MRPQRGGHFRIALPIPRNLRLPVVLIRGGRPQPLRVTVPEIGIDKNHDFFTAKNQIGLPYKITDMGREVNFAPVQFRENLLFWLRVL